MSPKYFCKISHPELDISLYLSHFSKEVSQLGDCQTNKKVLVIWKQCANIQDMSHKKFRKISHSEQEISLHLSNFSKEVSQQTDRQTYKNFRIIWNQCTNIIGMSPKDARQISHPGEEKSLFWLNLSKEVSQITLIVKKKCVGIWKQCEKILDMSHKKFRKISH